MSIKSQIFSFMQDAFFCLLKEDATWSLRLPWIEPSQARHIIQCALGAQKDQLIVCSKLCSCSRLTYCRCQLELPALPVISPNSVNYFLSCLYAGSIIHHPLHFLFYFQESQGTYRWHSVKRPRVDQWAGRFNAGDDHPCRQGWPYYRQRRRDHQTATGENHTFYITRQLLNSVFLMYRY